ncbi:hypothetical protein ACSTD8_22090 [Vibrio vulnificus]|uniref:hypothetical protein n=1 Tax=Vibrio vulnificus TaxID=672 RepID=UPI003ED9BD08
MNMTDIIEYISYLIAGIIIVPFGFMLFKEFMVHPENRYLNGFSDTISPKIAS